MEIVAVQSTNRHVKESVYVLDEWVSYSSVQLKLNLTSAANLRISVYSKQNDSITLIRDFGEVDYLSGDTLLSLGSIKGQIGVKFSFKEYLNYSDAYVSPYDNNKSYATLSVIAEAPNVDIQGNITFPAKVRGSDGVLGAQAKWWPCSVSRSISTNTQAGTLARTVLDTRIRLIIPDGPGMIRFVFRNCGIEGTQLVETIGISNIGTITVNGSMYDGFDNLWAKLTFNGNAYAEIAPGGLVISDPIAYSYLNNGLIRVKTHATAVNGYIPAMPIEGSDGISVAGADLSGTPGGAGFTTGAGFGFFPYCVLTDTPSKSVFAIGDSITDGVGDSGRFAQYNNYQSKGWIQRAASIAGVGAYIRGFPGAMASQLSFQYNPTLGTELAQIGASKFIFAFGTNDCQYRTISQMKADFGSAITKLKRLGFEKIYCPLILPRTTSSDGWITETNQTPVSGYEVGGVRDLMNEWLLNGADGQISGTINVISSVANGAKWKPRMTIDGTHPAGSGDDLQAVGNATALMANAAALLFAS